MSPDSALHLDLGTTEEYYGIPFVVVPASQAVVPISFGTDGADYSDESDPGPMPIPLDVPIEGGSTANPNPSSGDRHVLVVQQGDCVLYELYNTVRTGSGFMVSSSARWDLKINATRPAGWTSADAAGLPIFPGLVRYEEVEDGVIRHAIRFTVRRSRHAYLAPATHYASSSTNDSLPPMGMRVRLKASFDLSGFPPQAQVILQAMKTYGMMVADNGSDWFFQGTSDPRWDDDGLDTIKGITGSNFEVVKMGPLTTN
jgi:hypothetical protein